MWRHYIQDVVPADWERNDEQKAVLKKQREKNQRTRNFRLAKVHMAKNLNNFFKRVSYETSRARRDMEYYLNKLPLHQKMDILSKLNPQQRIVYDLVHADVEEIQKSLTAMVKAGEEEDDSDTG